MIGIAVFIYALLKDMTKGGREVVLALEVRADQDRAPLVWHAGGMRRSGRLRHFFSSYFPGAPQLEVSAWAVCVGGRSPRARCSPRSGRPGGRTPPCGRSRWR